MDTRTLLLALALLMAAGCGGRSSRIWQVGGDGGAGGFCSGSAKLAINDTSYTVTKLEGRVLAMGCCDGATLHFSGKSASGKGAEVSATIKVAGTLSVAQDLDLANLPSGVEVFISYQPCSPPVCSVMYQMNSLTHSFTGKASLSGDGTSVSRATICLTAQAPGDPNFTYLKLWANNVAVK